MRLLICICGFSILSPAIFAQDQEKKDKNVQFYVDVGLSLSDISFHSDNPEFAFLGGLNVFFKKPQIGVRYRKFFHYTYDRIAALRNQPVDRRIEETNIGYYETSTLEGYKKFNFSNSYDKDKFLTAGLGAGHIYPFYPDRPLWNSTVFVSVPLSFMEIELRTNILLQSRFDDWRIPQRRLIDIGTVFLSLYYRFPGNYYK